MRFKLDYMTVPGVMESRYSSRCSISGDTLPPRWSVHVHPEGQRYFHRSGEDASLSVVTESDVQKPETMVRITSVVKRIEEHLDGWRTPYSAIEVYIQVENDGGYYLINHTTRTVFWVDGHSTSELDLGVVASAYHLGKLIGHCTALH